MPRKYAPTGDQLSEHITEAMAIIADVDLKLAMLAEYMDDRGLGPLGKYLQDEAAPLQTAKKHLRAAEAIRKGLSARRQAALSREAKKRRSE